MVSAKSLLFGAAAVLGLLIAFIGLYATGMIGGVTIGVLSDTVTSGTIPVSTAMNTSLAGLETDYISSSEALFDITPIIAGIAIVVILMLVFGLKLNFGKKTSGGVN